MDQNGTTHYSVQSWPVSRQFDRAQLVVPVSLDAAGQRLRAWSVNVSEGGIALTVPAALPQGQEISATFEVAERAVSIKAVVRHGNGFRYGFEFLAISPEDQRAIRQYVSRPRPRHRGLRA
jgi:c-di-GMP-binding flagellar brake protein YcgR